MINILPVLFIIIIVVAILTMLTQFSFQQFDLVSAETTESSLPTERRKEKMT